jgi:hypothetical protein
MWRNPWGLRGIGPTLAGKLWGGSAWALLAGDRGVCFQSGLQTNPVLPVGEDITIKKIKKGS